MKVDLKEIQKDMGIGLWVWNTQTDELRWDDAMFTLFEVAPTSFSGTYETFKNRVHPEDLNRIDSDLKKCLSNGGEFTSVFKIILPKSNTIRYIKAYGSAIDEVTIAGVNILITHAEYFKYLNLEQADLIYIKNYTARRSLFSLKQKFIKPTKLDLVDSKQWEEMDFSIMPNTKYRILTYDKTGPLIVEWISMNGALDSHYHEENELLTNVGDAPIDVWVDGELTTLKQNDSIFIPKTRFHKLRCNGICHFMTTWFDFYKFNKTTFTIE
jgi:mannose-6-phosphate isomerase-like protein (cupin superfamily)